MNKIQFFLFACVLFLVLDLIIVLWGLMIRDFGIVILFGFMFIFGTFTIVMNAPTIRRMRLIE